MKLQAFVSGFLIFLCSFFLLNVQAEAKGLKGKVVSSVASKAKKTEILKNNQINGKKFENTMFQKWQKKKGNTQKQITLKVKDGTKVVADMIRRHNNKFSITEFKSSITAPLTKNQKKAFPQIEKYGAIVVGKGKPGFEGGTKIPPTKVFIKRNEK